MQNRSRRFCYYPFAIFPLFEFLTKLSDGYLGRGSAALFPGLKLSHGICILHQLGPRNEGVIYL
jgi:hypothetical protein